MSAAPRRPVRRLAVLSILLAPLAAGAFPSAAASATRPFSSADQVVALTNSERAEHGCPPLRVDHALSVAALEHGLYMADEDVFSHRGEGGSDSADRIRAEGYRAKRTGENIAAGMARAQEVVDAWMRSPGHRANILDCRLEHIGVARVHAPDSTYGYYWVQNFGAR